MLRAIRAFRSPNMPSNYFRTEIAMLRVVGIELLKEETKGQKIYSFISVFLWTYMYTFVELYEFYPSWGSDINQLTEVFMHSMTHVNGAVKMTLLVFNRQKFKRIIKILHEGFFKPDINRGGQDEFIHVRKCVKMTETMLLVYSSCIALVYLSNLTDTVIRLVFKPREEWKMTFLPISIVNTTYYPNYELGLIYQHTCIIMVAIPVIATDLLLVSIIAHLTCQFKILQIAFRNVNNRAVALKESREGQNMTFNECFISVLRDSVEHHLVILDLAVEMEELCNKILLIICSVSLLQLCFMLYQASLVEIGSLVFIKCLIYWIDISLQVFMYCFFADEVTVQSVKVIDSAMEIDWVGAPLSAQKALILVMARAYRPIHITAGKFIDLSLQMFMSIVKASFSYFMVLRQVKEEE